METVRQETMFDIAQRTAPKRSHGVIYEPRGRAREYSALAANLYRGCEHRCSYCYVVRNLGRNETAFASEFGPRHNILRKLGDDAAWRAARGDRRQVLFSFTQDPYQPCEEEYEITRQGIQILHSHRLPVCTLSKGGRLALRDLALFGPNDSYAATLTFRDAERSLEWEPGAALPADRMETLRAFHEAGVRTWVSLEPVLDPLESLAIIEATRGYVDHYKVGTLNHHEKAHTINWRQFGQQARALCETLGVSYYLKKDLRAHL